MLSYRGKNCVPVFLKLLRDIELITYVFLIKRLAFVLMMLFLHITQVIIVKRRKHRKEGELCKYSCKRVCRSRQHTYILLANVM